MDSTEARERLDSAATILRVADRDLRMQPWLLVIWGLFGTLVNAVQQAREMGIAVPRDSTLQLPLLIVAIIAVALLSLRPAGRETLMDRHAGIVFGVIFGVLLFASLTAQHVSIPYQAMSLFWSFGLAMAMLIVGIQASRPFLLGGLALVAASTIAGWVPEWFHGILAAGWTAGLVAPGLTLAWRRRDG